jgi:membrane protein implicated in regulation of membrane protease activity
MIGFAAFAVGVALWIFLPVKKVGMSVALGGIAMATAAYLLAAYAWVAGLAALVALVGVGVYIVYKYNRSNLANKENVDVIETLKDRYLTDEEQKTAFTSKTAEIPGRQSPSTRKLIREMRKDLGWTRT